MIDPARRAPSDSWRVLVGDTSGVRPESRSHRRDGVKDALWWLAICLAGFVLFFALGFASFVYWSLQL